MRNKERKWGGERRFFGNRLSKRLWVFSARNGETSRPELRASNFWFQTSFALNLFRTRNTRAEGYWIFKVEVQKSSGWQTCSSSVWTFQAVRCYKLESVSAFAWRVLETVSKPKKVYRVSQCIITTSWTALWDAGEFRHSRRVLVYSVNCIWSLNLAKILVNSIHWIVLFTEISYCSVYFQSITLYTFV